MARLSLTLLGGFQARLDSGEPLALPTRKAQALLAYLALPVGQAHPRDKLAAIFWGRNPRGVGPGRVSGRRCLRCAAGSGPRPRRR
jgi:DNA-binding SARP family transcriptional activator